MTSGSPVGGCVALTGATGFVGGHILRKLLAGGWRVKALTRHAAPLDDGLGSVTAVRGSLESATALAELVEDADTVVHCAGLLAARRNREFHQVNTIGTENLVRAAVASAKTTRFVLVSSLAAREPALSPYAASKREAEEVLRRLGSGLAWQILRPPVVYGPGDRATLDLFRQFSRGLVLLPASKGRFSMIYGEDLAEAVLTVLAAEGLSPQVMELDDGRAGGYGWEDLVAAVEGQLGRRVRQIAVPLPLQRAVAALSGLSAGIAGGAPFLSQGKVSEIAHPDWVCHNNRLNDLLPWRPSVQFDEGFPRTLAWYKAAGWL